MSSDKKQTFMKGALILMIANIIVKVIGAAFKIPITYLIGEEGMALFSTSYNVYTWLFIVATAGIPVAISRMISETRARGNHAEVERIFKVSFSLLTFIGVAGTLILFFGADLFSRLMDNPDAKPGIMAISPAILFVALMSAYRGYFQGHQNMLPTAISEVSEALGKLIIGFVFAYLLLDKGIIYASSGAVFGVAMGGLLGFLTLFFAYVLKSRKKNKNSIGFVRTKGTILKELIVIALPITIGASVFSLTSLIDVAMIMRNLQNGGFSYSEAKHLYGSYTGYAVPLFNLPPTLISAITISLVPTIAKALAEGDKTTAKATTANSIFITLIFALPCAVGMSLFAEPILALVYNNTNATQTLTVLALAIVFVSLVMVTNAILQSAGKEKIPVVNMLIGGVVKILVNNYLVKNPDVNILGAPTGTILCYAVILVLNMVSLVKVIKIRFSFMQYIVKPIVSVVLMGTGALVVYNGLFEILGMKISLVAAIGSAVVIYLAALLVMRTLDARLISSIPGLSKLAPVLIKLKLIKSEDD